MNSKLRIPLCWKDASGCDSTATLELTINNSSSSSTTISECDSYKWNGIDYTTSGMYIKHFINASGCDSTATLNLTINKSTSSSIDITECEGFIWNGVTYSESSRYEQHFTNATGCDSTAYLNLTINYPSSSTTNVSECDTYIWNGINYAQSGTFDSHFTNAMGCDSTAILKLDIRHSTQSLQTISECDNYLWNGNDYTESGNYSIHFMNSAGCDSTANLQLTIKNSSSSFADVTECESFTWNDFAYTKSGTYEAHFTNADGCDSMATLRLNINKSSASSFSATACDNYMLPWNQSVNTSGLYKYTYTNFAGCDSIVSANITINNTPSAPQVTIQTSCSGSVISANNFTGTLLWSNGQTSPSITVTTPGVYSVTQSINNCTGQPSTDSIPLDQHYGAPANPAPINGSTVACAGQYGIIFSIPPVPGATSYVWGLPSGTTGSSNGTSITIHFRSSFTGGNICVRPVNACGSGAATCLNIKQATTIPIAAKSINGPNIICPMNTATFSVAQPSNVSGYDWSVSTNLTIQSGQGTNTIIVKASSGFSSGYIKVKAKNCQGASASTTKTIKGFPSKPVWKITPPAFVCGGSCYNFNIDNVQDASTWTYSAPAGCTITSLGVAGSGNPITTSVSFATICFPVHFDSGTITITSTNNCGQSQSLTYFVRSKPMAPNAIRGPVSGVCGARDVVYSVNPVAGATSYSWTLPPNVNMIINDGSSITVDFLNNFSGGSICVKAKNACGSSQKICIDVSSAPAQPADINGPQSVCKNQANVVYSIPAVVGATSYSWSVTSGATITGNSNQSSVAIRFTSVNSPTCTLSVKAKNDCGNSSSRKMIITVARNCRTGEFEMEEQSISEFSMSMYPNPANTKTTLRINSENKENYKMTLIDLLGNVLMEESIVINEGVTIKEINLENRAKGIYFIIMKGDKGITRNIRLIVN